MACSAGMSAADEVCSTSSVTERTSRPGSRPDAVSATATSPGSSSAWTRPAGRSTVTCSSRSSAAASRQAVRTTHCCRAAVWPCRSAAAHSSGAGSAPSPACTHTGWTRAEEMTPVSPSATTSNHSCTSPVVSATATSRLAAAHAVPRPRAALPDRVGVVPPPAALAGRLRRAQGGVRLAEGQLAPAGVHPADADPRADREGPAADAAGLSEHLDDPPGGLDRGLLVRGEQDGELVAAQAGDQVLLAQQALQPPGHLDQQQVAVLVPGGVVDRLEAVEVQHQQAPVTRGGGQVGQLAEEQGAVGQPGQVVGERHPLQLAFAAPAGGDVPQVQDTPAAGGPLVVVALQLARLAGGPRHPQGDGRRLDAGGGELPV